MNPEILKLTMVVLLLLFTGASCQKDEMELADESIEISSIPGISIYKTKSDYKNYLTVCLDTAGNITCTPLFGNDPDIVSTKKDGRFTLNNRHFLKSNYILEDIYLDHAFTDITIMEMVQTFTDFGAGYWSHEKYLNRIIEKDPFLDFYHFDGIGKPERIFTIGEINDMIENSTLETVFTKLK